MYKNLQKYMRQSTKNIKNSLIKSLVMISSRFLLLKLKPIKVASELSKPLNLGSTLIKLV